GAVARRQLLGAGLSRFQVDRATASGLLVAEHRGVYRAAAAPETAPFRLMAATLAGGPHSGISHRAASVLWRLIPSDEVIDLVVPEERPRRLRGVQAHRAVVL